MKHKGGISIREWFLISMIVVCNLTIYLGSAIDVPIKLEEFASIDVIKSVMSYSEENITFLITVNNTGEIKLTDVMVKDILPLGIKHISSKYKNPDESFLSRCLDIGKGDETKSIIWKLGSLETEQKKEILLSVSKKNYHSSKWLDEIYAEGLAINNLVHNSKIYRAEIRVEKPEFFEINDSIKIKFNTSYPSANAKRTICKFNITNKGDTIIENVILMANLSNGMKFGNTGYLSAGIDGIFREVYIDESDENSENNITLNLGSIAPNKKMSVILASILKPGENTSVVFEVKGKAYGIVVNDSQNGVVSPKCYWRDEDNETCDWGEDNAKCNQFCDWIFSPR